MKYLLFVYLLFSFCESNKIKNSATLNSSFNKDYSRYHEEALAYCKENNMNDSYYFLLDYSIHSGKNRFFIYDFEKQKIINQKLVTHGSCDVFEENTDKWEKAKFSNQVDSHCAMKGKYKIGNRDYSSWGIHVKYWLHGLEPTNSTAVKRVVVLHSWNAVSTKEIYPKYSPLSWGCPAVSNEFMQALDEKLKQTNKPVLLWIIA
ncbi:murein L,D-transpeptidase catalytic domain-containing protein [Flavobacterium sp.]|uniref:murein L,D-transpeptidase catalytic domain-containing protein n=1 Tax=Flavobacterium sp. TaxID=239 RepID=UPI00352725D4